ncbi:MAG: L,D-transpeptidase [Pseudomonadota bacterium]
MRNLVAPLVVIASFATPTTLALSAPQNDPLQVIVSLQDQELKVYRGNELITSSNISSGKKGNDTPTGIFSVLQKNRHHRSNIYSNAPMPFMQRLTWSGIALHASNHVPDYPASHGCIRLPHKFARELFKMDTRGMHVIIEDSPQRPLAIQHENLFQPKYTWKTNKAYDGWVNEHIADQNAGFQTSDQRYPARIFITRRTHKDDLYSAQRLLNKLGFNAGEVDGIMGPATWKAVKSFKKFAGLPVDGKVDHIVMHKLYSQANERPPANGQLFVRKHHKTIYSTQINITKPDRPLGSHILTVSGYDAKKGSTEWMSVTLDDRVQEKINLKSGSEVRVVAGRQRLASALERIEMSKLDREQVSRFLSPGSSLTISDNGMSVETGAKGTDFIVLTKPHPKLGELALNKQ